MSLTIDVFGSKDLIVGEVDLKRFQIERSDKANITVSSATYEIFNSDGISLGASASADITDNGTPLVTISADVSAGTNPGKRYCEFTVVIDRYTKKTRLTYEVKK